jgi:hypothetical protein
LAGKSSENKTRPTAVSVTDFLAAVEPEARRADAQALCEIMGRLSGEPAVMWGPTIIGFGSKHYRYESGREGVVPAAGFAPRKPALVLYLGLGPRREDFLARLGRHATGKGCIYVKRLADVDTGVLEAMIATSLSVEGVASS